MSALKRKSAQKVLFAKTLLETILVSVISGSKDFFALTVAFFDTIFRLRWKKISELSEPRQGGPVIFNGAAFFIVGGVGTIRAERCSLEIQTKKRWRPYRGSMYNCWPFASELQILSRNDARPL